MALAKGTNCGFVSGAPSADPGASAAATDTYSVALKDTSPVGAVQVTEIGWWCDNATEAANYQVAIYTHDAGNNRPDAIIGSASEAAKGTTAGWKKITGLSIPISPSTIYWIALQLDDTATNTNTDWAASAGDKFDYKASQTSLPSSWGISDGTYAYLRGTYALVSIATEYEQAVGGTLASTGVVVKTTLKPLSGTLALSAVLATVHIFTQAIGGILAFSGNIVRQTNKALSGILAQSGTISKSTSVSRTGILALTGAVNKLSTRALIGSLTFIGSIAKQINKNCAGQLELIAEIQKQINKNTSGTLDLSATIQKFISKNLSGTLTLTGVANKLIAQAIEGLLRFYGRVNKRTNKSISGSLTLRGILRKLGWNRILRTALSWTADTKSSDTYTDDTKPTTTWTDDTKETTSWE